MTSTPGPRHRTHRAQEGLTLIEIIAALFLMTIGVLALIEGLAASQHYAAISTDQAQLEASSREVGDYLRSTAVGYITCDKSGVTDTYGPHVISGLGPAFSTKWQPKIVEVAEATGASVAPPLSTPTAVPAETTTPCTDWGVQRITFQVTSSSTSRTLVRAVFKWDTSPSPAP